MDQLARDLSAQAVFLFVYAREAHPDEFPDHPAHKSFAQKWQHALDLRDRHLTPRTILVDDLDGTVHRTYGARPNMSWIIDHTGRVAYKADWTSAADIRTALEDVVRIRELKRQEGFRDFYRETMTVLKMDTGSRAERMARAIENAAGAAIDRAAST